MDIRTEASVPTGPLPTGLVAPVPPVVKDPNAVLQDMAARYVGMTLGPLPAAVSTDPAVLAAVSAVTAFVSSGVGVPGSIGSLLGETLPAGGRLAESAGLGAAVNPFPAGSSFTGRPPGGVSAPILGQSLSGKATPEGGLFGDSSFSELSPRGSGAVTVSGPAPRLPDAGGLVASGGAMVPAQVTGPGAANALSGNSAGELAVLPALSRLAGVADKALVTDRPLSGAPASARAGILGPSSAAISSKAEFFDALAEWVRLDQLAHQDDRARRNSLETQLIAEMLVFARAQGARAHELRRWSWDDVPEAEGSIAPKKKVGADAQAKAQLKFFGRKASRLSKRNPREKDKDRKRQGKSPLPQQGDSDDPESP